jgi:hypothetical protein
MPMRTRLIPVCLSARIVSNPWGADTWLRLQAAYDLAQAEKHAGKNQGGEDNRGGYKRREFFFSSALESDNIGIVFSGLG